MDENLFNMIFKRKSFHLFRNIGNIKINKDEIDEIINAYQTFTPLYENIKTKLLIVPNSETTCKRGQEYSILLYSEKKEGYLANIGYLGEQLDLYLVNKNIGTLWFGIGKVEKEKLENYEFVIMIAIAKVDSESKFRKDMFKSKRKPLEEIWIGNIVTNVSDIVRFAPSACNTQPWIVENVDNKLNIYRYKKPNKRGIMPKDKVTFYNKIDIGIFLCFLELSLIHNKINFERTLLKDEDNDLEKVLVATYCIKKSPIF